MFYDELLFVESEGDFIVKEWDDVYEMVKDVCCCLVLIKEGMEMVFDDEYINGLDLCYFLWFIMENKVVFDFYWK